MANAEKFDVVVYGASGYTGRLVAEYMAKQYGPDSGVRWAMAGRNKDKLEKVRDEIGAPAETPIVIADASDSGSIDAMVDAAKVVCTTVGPYQLYGEPLVAACAKRGVGYVDLCGEPAWMHTMIETYQDTAKQSGARIVFSCGFDSVPFDLGVYYLQEQAKEALGGPAPRVRGRVRAMNGRFSGGTAASFHATMKAAGKDPSIIGILRDPFALTPGFSGPEQPDDTKPALDDSLDMWVAPFIMASINTKNVHRSNFLMGHPYGENFRYDEMVLTGPGDEGKEAAKAVANANPLTGDDVPEPGEGPSKEEREAGNYDVLFIGEADDGRTIKTAVTGDMDPGYGSTSKIVAECAVSLARDITDAPGGIYTPAAIFGMRLVDRLQNNAGLTFKRED